MLYEKLLGILVTREASTEIIRLKWLNGVLKKIRILTIYIFFSTYNIFFYVFKSSNRDQLDTVLSSALGCWADDVTILNLSMASLAVFLTSELRKKTFR